MLDTLGEAAQPSIVVNPSCLGRMEEFTPGSDWKHYVERLAMFFKVNSVPIDKRVQSVLTLMGSKMYALLRSISVLRKPKELNFTEIVDTLAQHVDPKPIIIAERYKFHKAEQGESETVRQYLAKLQKLAETCKFGAYREEAFRDWFVCSLRSQSIQRKLLAEATLTLQTAVEKACASELREKEASGFHVPPMMLRKWRELFPNGSDVVKPIILQKNVFIVKHSAMDARSLATLLSSVWRSVHRKPREEKTFNTQRVTGTNCKLQHTWLRTKY